MTDRKDDLEKLTEEISGISRGEYPLNMFKPLLDEVQNTRLPLNVQRDIPRKHYSKNNLLDTYVACRYGI